MEMSTFRLRLGANYEKLSQEDIVTDCAWFFTGAGKPLWHQSDWNCLFCSQLYGGGFKIIGWNQRDSGDDYSISYGKCT